MHLAQPNGQKLSSFYIDKGWANFGIALTGKAHQWNIEGCGIDRPVLSDYAQRLVKDCSTPRNSIERTLMFAMEAFFNAIEVNVIYQHPLSYANRGA